MLKLTAIVILNDENALMPTGWKEAEQPGVPEVRGAAAVAAGISMRPCRRQLWGGGQGGGVFGGPRAGK